MGVWPLREQLDRTYLALCRRTRKVPVITEQIVVSIYLRYLPEELGVQVRDLAPDADLEILYTAAKFAAAREDRRTTHPLLRETRGLPLPSGDAAGLLMISGESDGSSGPKFAARELRGASAHTADRAVHRHGGGFYRDSTGPPASERRREGFPDRPARPTVMPSHLPPMSYAPRERFGFEDAHGRDEKPPIPRNRTAGRRYSADPRPTRWPQVRVMNVQPLPAGPLRPMGVDYYTPTPRRALDLPSSAGTSGWNPCFACAQTGHRLRNCTKDLQECARDLLRANCCPACNAMWLCPADCRRRLYFATFPYPLLELNKEGTSYFIRCGLPMPRWYRPELLVGSARAVSPAMPSPAVPEYRAAYAVRSAALPHAAAPASPAPPATSPTSTPTEAGPTRCVRPLTWTPGFFVMDPGSAKRALPRGLRPTVAALGDSCHAAGSPPVPFASVVSGQARGIVEGGGKPATEDPSTLSAVDPGNNRGARAPGMGQLAADLGGSAAQGAAGGVANVLFVRRDVGNAARAGVSRKDARPPRPRLPPPNCRPAQTRAMASLDGSRCVVIVDTGAHVSLVSARALRPGVKYLPWSERDVRTTGVAQQGVTILGRMVLKMHFCPVRALTPFLVALGVGFDAILGVDFLYAHNISVNLAQHCLVFEAHDDLIVPLVGYHPSFKHACALTHDVSLRPGARALVRCTCECLRGMIMPPGLPEVHLLAARKD